MKHSTSVARRAMLVVSALLCLTPAAAGAESSTRVASPKKVERLVEKGDALLERGRCASAIERYEKASALTDGGSVEARIGLVRAGFRLGRYADAVRLAEEARSSSPSPEQEAELAYLAGRSHFDSAHIVRANAEAAEAVEARAAKLATAEGFLRHAAETAPEAPPESRYFLGRIHEERQDHDAAERDYREYLRLAPEGERAPAARLRLDSLGDPGEAPIAIENDTQPPVAIDVPQPCYAPEALEALVQGQVSVRITVDRAGDVTEVQLLEGRPKGLNRAALAAAMRWRFEPARLPDGRPVPVYFTETFDFTLDSGDIDLGAFEFDDFGGDR